MTYKHSWIDGSDIELPTGKVVCVGRNYAAHAKELGNDVPEAPILFIKPSTSLTAFDNTIVIPQGLGEVHHEIEMAVLIREPLKAASAETCQWSIAGYALALDLTLRDIQNQLKANGQPWERAKAFDGACPVSGFVDYRGVSVRQTLDISLAINGKIKQKGNTAHMLFPTFELISYISHHFTLEPGDLVLTGTPAGVGPLQPGDKLHANLGNILSVQGQIVSH